MMATMPDLHPDIAALGFLLGQWEGTGAGKYPTIAPFAYRERIAFGHVGKPFLSYTQRTSHPDTGAPMHAEVGYLRQPGAGRVELTLAQPNGVVETHAGTIDGTTLRLASTTVATTPTAKRVDAVERDIVVEGDVLTYALRMAAVGEPMTHHLSATLTRVPAPTPHEGG